MTRLLPLLFLAGCVPEPVFLPDAPHWGHMPLSVCVSSYPHEYATREDYRLYFEATESIRREFRFEVFRLGTTWCDVELVVGVPHDASWVEPGGRTWRGRDGVVHVEMANVLPECRYQVLRHELGHVMGLADDDRNTAMASECTGVFPTPTFSDRDVRAVRERYGRD
jgi:hypothetical protein